MVKSGNSGRSTRSKAAGAPENAVSAASDSTRSQRSARSLSVAAAELKVPVDAVKQIASATRRLGADQVVDVLRKAIIKENQTEKGENPSDLARHSVAREVQFGCEGDPRFICYRGPPEAHVSIPLALVEKRFFDFRLNAAATSDVEETDLETAYELWRLCTRGWDDEVKQMTPDVNKLFQRYLRRFVSPTGIDNKTADGVVEGIMVLFEHKLQPADGYFQALDYFRRRFLSSRESGFSLSYGLLVLVACPHIQAVAVVMDWESDKVLAEPLTGFVNCFGPEEFDEDVLHLAAVLRAVRLFCSSYRADDNVDPAVPFALSSKPVQRFKDRLVFLMDPPYKVAKLTKTYSDETHKVWADKSIAPPLHTVQAIGGGWMLVEMAFLGSADGWEDGVKVVSQCLGDSEALATLTECIRVAAAKGHSTGYVHGDMRLPNIKIRRVAGGSFFEVMFIDFDWAGKAGKARYPTLLNPKLGWAKGAGYGKLILPDHDLHFVNTLVEQLKQI